MKKDKEFENILDDCLERLLVKGETLEQCLGIYPEHAAELEPLLRTAVATSQAVDVQPAPEFKARARYQFQSIFQQVKPRRRLPVLSWQPRWAMVLVIVLAVFLAGSGTVVAADSSMPGSPLYPVKLVTEQVRLQLTPSDIHKAELYAVLADRRVNEIAYLVNKGKNRLVEKTAERLKMHLAKMNNLSLAQMTQQEMLAGPSQVPPYQGQASNDKQAVSAWSNKGLKLKIMVGHYAVNHPARLRALLATAPESVKPALQRAIDESVASYQQALRYLGNTQDDN